ncbi:MAG: radical SAM protein [Candidatus Tectomicrobia bacterium]|uniref:Radical SAM protein n=1 Tax=Tectimicrobiota bacterium TaxID=2528274 RepID=A0A933GK41_UNCTE|nr:radical SAM protein [Candidatus Tectomicrobia bacterium]
MALADRLKSTVSYYAGSARSGGPYRLVVEITNACNLACNMCPRRNMKRKIQLMSRDLFTAIMENNSRGLEFVALNGFGEPLLHPGLFDYLEICRHNNIQTGLSTNCTMLDEKTARVLLDHPPDQITLALDGITRDSYEKIRLGARFDEVLTNIEFFLRLHEERKGKPYIVIQCIYMTENKEEVDKFRRFLSPFKYNALRVRQLTHSGEDRKDANYRHRSGACYWLWNEPMILSDGTVVPCCQDVNGELALGKVSEKSLQDLWQEGFIQELRRKHGADQRASIPLCSKCNMYQPSVGLALGAACLNTPGLNRWVPAIETALSFRRYRVKSRNLSSQRT